MKCEAEYCIYNRKHICTIDTPEINALGMCAACIVISLDKNFLEKEKERQLLEIENHWLKLTKKPPQ